MSKALQLIENGYARRLIRQAMPRANRGHEIAELMKKFYGWEIIEVKRLDTGEFYDYYSIQFFIPPEQEVENVRQAIEGLAERLTDNKAYVEVGSKLNDGTRFARIQIRRY